MVGNPFARFQSETRKNSMLANQDHNYNNNRKISSIHSVIHPEYGIQCFLGISIKKTRQSNWAPLTVLAYSGVFTVEGLI